MAPECDGTQLCRRRKGPLTIYSPGGDRDTFDLDPGQGSIIPAGYFHSQKIAHFWEYGASKLHDHKDSAEAYLIQGKAPRPGDIFRQPDLANTLQLLAKGGREAFYEGPIAKQIVDYCKLHGGGYLDLEDFKAQKCFWVPTISIDYRGIEIHEIPPNGQGLVALEALKIIEDLIQLGHERISGESIPQNWVAEHLFVISFKGGAQAILKEGMSLVGASDSRLDGIPIGY